MIKMIIVQIIGGLGNQMFQYALAKKLKFKLGYTVKLDITAYDSYKLHNYCLDVFKLDIPVATLKEIEICKNNNILDEPQFNYWDKIYDIQENTYIRGYWQSEKYFLDIRKDLLNDFSVRRDLSAKTLNAIKIFNEKRNTVSIHIRRGDYVANPLTLKIHGICSDEYYKQAVNYFNNLFEKPFFVIFSDDINWVKENLICKLNIDNYYCIDFNDITRNYEDILLMSKCNHNIIANSSFSWWGAWLNNNEKKQVVAPKNWFNEATYNSETIVPEQWLRF
ncbi:alpha-1,2-fucosyltransferase [Lysinibacillus fusiformis]|uniref:alpha-1,2-fucosyltransferase n=1 Tax=Lysinibacillus fusiformis TaxID=28031 RepID=UPI003CFFE5ED